MYSTKWNKITKITAAAGLWALLTGCTAEQQNEFEALGKNQRFLLAEEIQTPGATRDTDMLFVIDNSGSMKPAQDRLRASFAQFAQTYFKPEYNVCVAVITTDLYRQANPANIQKHCTKLPDGSQADLQALTTTFMQFADVGVLGHGSERALHSVQHMIEKKERPLAGAGFFRKGAFKVVVFVTDEDDQSVADAQGAPMLGSVYLATCPMKAFGTYQYALDNCIDTGAAALYGVAAFKGLLDQYLNNEVDAGVSNKLGYMVVGITLATEASLKRVRKTGSYATPADPNWANLADSFKFYDRAQRIEDLAAAAGNGSFIGDITAPDYSTILEMIGAQIDKKLSTFTQFTLSFPPKADETLVVTITRAATGATERVASTQFRIEGNTLAITDAALVATFKKGDVLDVFYVPASLAQ